MDRVIVIQLHERGSGLQFIPGAARRVLFACYIGELIEREPQLVGGSGSDRATRDRWLRSRPGAAGQRSGGREHGATTPAAARLAQPYYAHASYSPRSPLPA